MKHRISWRADSVGKEKPPRLDPGGEKNPIGRPSALQRIAALPVPRPWWT